MFSLFTPKFAHNKAMMVIFIFGKSNTFDLKIDAAWTENYGRDRKHTNRSNIYLFGKEICSKSEITEESHSFVN